MPEPSAGQIGGMALANGLLVHGPHHWAAAIHDRAGRVQVASGRKPRAALGPLRRAPLIRGLLRIGEAIAVLPAMRRRLPDARFAVEERPALVALAVSAVVASRTRHRMRPAIAAELAATTLSIVPSLIALRTSRAAVWHGVEHKSIAAYEAGGAAGLAYAGEQAKEHRRCGSNLVLPLVATTTLTNLIARALPGPTLGQRLALSALSMGFAVEAFAFATRRPRHPVARAIHASGHAIQAGFVTREPRPADMELGRLAMTELLRAEAVQRT